MSHVKSKTNPYLFQVGTQGQQRLELVHEIHSPDSIQFLENAQLSKGMRVIDLGCGTGTMSEWLAKKVGATGKVIGIDNSRDQIKQAQQRLNTHNINHVEFIVSDINDIDQHDLGHFDLLYCRYVLHHLQHPLAAIKKMIQLMPPKSKLILEEPNHSQFYHIPDNPDFNKARDLLLKIATLNGLDYNIGDKLFSMIINAQLPVTIQALESSTPIVFKEYPKRMLELVTQEFAPRYLESELIDEDELIALINRLKQLSTQKSGLVSFTRTIQLLAEKQD